MTTPAYTWSQWMQLITGVLLLWFVVFFLTFEAECHIYASPTWGSDDDLPLVGLIVDGCVLLTSTCWVVSHGGSDIFIMVIVIALLCVT